MNYKRNPFKKATPLDNGTPSNFLKVTNFRSPTPMDNFYSRTVDNADGTQSITQTTDIYMLLNQKRLDRATLDAFTQQLDNLSVNSPEMTALRQKCTDAQLLQFCKSRYIQAPSQLLAWSKYIESMYPQASPESAPSSTPAPESGPTQA